MWLLVSAFLGGNLVIYTKKTGHAVLGCPSFLASFQQFHSSTVPTLPTKQAILRILKITLNTNNRPPKCWQSTFFQASFAHNISKGHKLNVSTLGINNTENFVHNLGPFYSWTLQLLVISSTAVSDVVIMIPPFDLQSNQEVSCFEIRHPFLTSGVSSFFSYIEPSVTT